MSEEKSPLLNGTGGSSGGEGKPGKASVKGVDVERLPGYDGHFAAAPKRRKYYFFSNVLWYATPPSSSSSSSFALPHKIIILSFSAI
jgi:hypothetical protein